MVLLATVTSVSFLQFALYLLARPCYGSSLAQLLAEIDSFPQEASFTADDLDNMPYLDAVSGPHTECQ